MATNSPIKHQHEPTINIQPWPASVWKPTRFGWPKTCFSLKPTSRKQQGLICTVLSSIELHQHTYEHYGVGNCVLDDSHQPMGLSKHRVFLSQHWHLIFVVYQQIFTHGISILDNSSQSGPQVWCFVPHYGYPSVVKHGFGKPTFVDVPWKTPFVKDFPSNHGWLPDGEFLVTANHH